MRNIRVFDTQSEFLATQQAVSGTGEYVQDIDPGFAYIREYWDDGNYAVYNQPPQPEWEYVDLGLPSGTLWATRNVGANAPEEYGGYYAWGEIAEQEHDPVEPGVDDGGDDILAAVNPGLDGARNSIRGAALILGEGTRELTNTSYSEQSYRFGPVDMSSSPDYGITKYNGVDGMSRLDLEDDVAHVVMGGDWHIPTYCQCKELLDNSNYEWTALNGVLGVLFTSQINGNTLFFPAAGIFMNGSPNGAGGSFIIHSCDNDVEPEYFPLLPDVLWGYENSEDRAQAQSLFVSVGTTEYGRWMGASVRGVLGAGPSNCLDIPSPVD